MKPSEFETWIQSFDLLDSRQRQALREKLKGESSDNNEVALLAQNTTEPACCPHCASTEKPYHWGHSYNLPRYRCRNCKRTFTALTGTSLAGLYIKHKGKLLNYDQVIAQGLLSKSQRGVAILCGDSIICAHPHYPVEC